MARRPRARWWLAVIPSGYPASAVLPFIQSVFTNMLLLPCAKVYLPKMGQCFGYLLCPEGSQIDHCILPLHQGGGELGAISISPWLSLAGFFSLPWALGASLCFLAYIAPCFMEALWLWFSCNLSLYQLVKKVSGREGLLSQAKCCSST